MASLRIFISSPGDVVPERRRAALVIEKLAKDYARFFEIRPYLWESEPMLASGHFQDIILPPGETDVVVLILWARLGTALPEAKYQGLDGRTPVTGTEWEFENALAAHRQRGTPDLLAYKKDAPPRAEYRSDADLEALRRQWQQLDTFWSRYFVDQGEFRAAFAQFDDLDSFEAKLESDLRRLIERRIASLKKGAEGPTAATWLKGSPFRGLEIYRFEHAPIFFGRSEASKSAVERLVENAENGNPFLLVLGASGAGKSSLAQAGIVPALGVRGVVPGVGAWRRGVMRPGGSGGPFMALAAALSGPDALPELLNGQKVSALARHLEGAAADPSFPIVSALSARAQVARKSGELLTHEDVRLVLVVDQLEELFTLGEVTPEQRQAFVRCLDGLMKDGRVFVVATMRSDYWHRAAEIPALIALAEGHGRVDLLPPTQAEIAMMIARPAEVAGLAFEADPRSEIGLDAAIAADAAQQPGALPLLSFLLDALYAEDVQAANGSVLRYTSMRKLGGFQGAIATRAEAAFAALPAQAQAALPKVLRELVTVSRSGAEPTARLVPMDRFAPGSGEREVVEAFLDPQVRLLVADGDGTSARVRVAHEALITHWDRAKAQIAQDRDDLRTRAMVEEALTEWRAAAPAGKSGYLLRDPQLASAIDVAKRWGDELAAETRAFIEASRRRARLLQRLTLAAAAVFAIVAVLAGVATFFAQRAQQLAETQRTRAQAQEALALAQEAKALTAQSRFLVDLAGKSIAEGEPATAAALALEALPDPPHGINRPYLVDAERSLFGALQDLHEVATLRGHTWTVNDVAFSPDGRTLLTSSWDHHVKLWDTGTWKERLDLYDNAGAISTARFSPDSRSVLVATNDGTARIFDATTGAVVHRLTAPRGAMNEGRYAPDGARVVTVGAEKVARLWDAATGQLVAALAGHADTVHWAAFSPDSRIVATAAADRTVKGWRSSDGQLLFDIPALPEDITALMFSPDGRYLAASAADGAVRLWSAADGKPARVLSGPKSRVITFAFSPDSKRIAGVFADHIVRVWQAASGQEILQLKGHTDTIVSIVFSPDGKFVATASLDRTVRLWGAESGRERAVLRGHGSGVLRVAFSPDSRMLASVSGERANLFDRVRDNTARVWNVGSALELATIRDKRRILEASAVSPDGKLVVVRDAEGDFSETRRHPASARLWNAETHDELRDLRDPVDSVMQAIAAADGSRILTLGRSGAATLWDPVTARKIATYDPKESAAYLATFSPDGSLVALAVRSRDSQKYQIITWRANDGSQIESLAARGTQVSALSISADGRLLATTYSSFGSDAGFSVWALAGTGSNAPTAVQSAPVFVKHAGIKSATFADGGKVVLAADEDGSVRAWNSNSGALEKSWGAASDFATTTVVAPDGRFFAMTSMTDGAAKARIIDRSTGQEHSIVLRENETPADIIFAPSGDRLLVPISGSGKIRVIKATDARLIAEIGSADGPQLSSRGSLGRLLSDSGAPPPPVQFSNHGTMLALGDADGAIDVWDLGSGRPLQRLVGHKGGVASVVFSPGDDRLVSGSADETVRIWELAAGKEIAVLRGHQGTIRALAYLGPSRILSVESETPATAKNKILLVDAATGKAASEIALAATEPGGEPPAIDAISFSQAGDRLLVNGSTVYEAQTGKRLMSLADGGDPLESRALVFGSDAIMSPSGRLLARYGSVLPQDGEERKRIEIFDVASAKMVRSIELPPEKSAEAGRSESLSFSPDEKYLAGQGSIWSVATGELWTGPLGGEKVGHQFSPDGKLLAAISKGAPAADPFENAAVVSDARTGSIRFLLRGHAEAVSAVAISPDGKMIVTGSRDESIRFWDAASGRQTGIIDLKDPKKELAFPRPIYRLKFSPDARLLVVAREDELKILDATTRAEIKSIPVGARVAWIDFSRDGRLMCARDGWDQSLQLWELETFREIKLPADGKIRGAGAAAAFSPDGRQFANIADGGQVLITDVKTGATVARLRGHSYQATGVSYSPDGRLIATTATNEKLRLWDASTFAETVVDTDRDNGFTELAFSSDGRLLALAGRDGTIDLWDPQQRKHLRTLKGHDGEIERVRFVDGGKRIVSVGKDRTVRTWSVDSGEQLASVAHYGEINDVAIADAVIVSAGGTPREAEERFQLELWDLEGRRKLELRHEQLGEFRAR
ncbi:MAG: hypothetical protein JO000_11135, partial [Alphaproteobacteria bacterium]|nr:hypothetical protein [Alphaproteobacteria bacterium]